MLLKCYENMVDVTFSYFQANNKGLAKQTHQEKKSVIL